MQRSRHGSGKGVRKGDGCPRRVRYSMPRSAGVKLLSYSMVLSLLSGCTAERSDETLRRQQLYSRPESGVPVLQDIYDQSVEEDLYGDHYNTEEINPAQGGLVQ